MNYCFICETPFHVLNCANYAYSLTYEKDVKNVYIRNEKYLNSDLQSRLKTTGIFNNVYSYKYPTPKNNFEFHMLDALRTVLPQRYLSLVLNSKNKFETDYDYVFTAVPTDFVFAAKELNPQAHLIYFDDGSGSYMDSMRTLHFENAIKLLNLFHKEINLFKPDCLYLNNPDFCIENSAPLKKLPSLKYADPKLIDKLNYVFNYEITDIYKQHKYIYLTMPNDKGSSEFEKINTLFETKLSKLGKNILVRKHPRDMKTYEGFDLDTTNNMWELVSSSQITDNHILIGVFSTAQLTPKMLYDIEPYLIFTYPSYANVFGTATISNFEKFIYLLKDKYRDPSKIFVLEDLNELDTVIAKIKSDKK